MLRLAGLALPPAVLVSISVLAAALTAAQPRSEPPHRVVGYFAEWGIYQRNYHVADIPAAKLTHINYAFAKINAAGECDYFDKFAAIEKAYPGDKWEEGVVRGNFKQLQQLKQKHPHLKTLISVGGWTLSGPFSDVALTEAARRRFAQSCVRFAVKHGFDGVDIDWEYPVGGGLPANKTRPEDKRNCTPLLSELRQQLDKQGAADGRRYLLTIAAPAGPRTFANLELPELAKVLDWFNLMTYDFHGGWSDLTNFNAPLYASSTDPTKDEEVRKKFNVEQAVKAYIAAGVPRAKIVLGLPAYGRGWGGVKNVNRGLYQPHAADSPRGTWEAGNWDYKDLAANYVGKFQRHWHEEAKVPWLFDPASGVMISYDDPESIRIKSAFARTERLGGVMFWELSGDTRDAALLNAARAGLDGK